MYCGRWLSVARALDVYNQTVVYGNPGVLNTYQVVAVDSSGNESAPASLTTCAGAVCYYAVESFER